MKSAATFLLAISLYFCPYLSENSQNVAAAEDVLSSFKKYCTAGLTDLIAIEKMLVAAGWRQVKPQDNKQLLAISKANLQGIKNSGANLRHLKQKVFNKKSNVFLDLTEIKTDVLTLRACYIYHFGANPNDHPDKISTWLGGEYAKTAFLKGLIEQFIWRSPNKLPKYSNVKLVHIHNDPSILIAAGWTGYSISASATSR